MQGSGTELDPYLVTSAADLDDVRDDLTAYYRQTADITLSGEWVPIADWANNIEFEGHYDGGGYKINGLSITAAHGFIDYFVAALFSCTSDAAEIQNVDLVNVIINQPNCDCAGALVGYNSGTVTNCKSSGIVRGYCNVGGLFGYGGGEIKDCSSTCEVTGYDCVELGYEHDSFNVGAFMGAFQDGTVSECFATGDAEGTDNVGGFVGAFVRPVSAGLIENCYAQGDVAGNANSSRVAGFAGSVAGNIDTSYSTGDVTNPGSNTGGFAGYKYSYAEISDCYYDSETSGQSDDDGRGVPKTTAEMKDQDTFVDWYFDTVWRINTGEYPTFKPTVSPYAPTIVGPAKLACAIPAIIMTTVAPPGNAGSCHFKLQSYADEAMTTLIGTQDSSLTPEFWLYSMNGGLSWENFPVAGLDSAKYGARVGARVPVGARKQVYLKASMGVVTT